MTATIHKRDGSTEQRLHVIGVSVDAKTNDLTVTYRDRQSGKWLQSAYKMDQWSGLEVEQVTIGGC